MTLEQAYELANREQLGTLASLQNPNLEPEEIRQIIERLQLNLNCLTWLRQVMNEQGKLQ